MATSLSWYVPPPFPLAEVRPHVRTPEGVEPVRWFVGFNGRVGRPAREVALGWRLGPRLHVVVSTEALLPGHDPESSGRFRAAMLALAGPLPWLLGPDPPRASGEQVRSLAESERWSPTFVGVQGQRRAAWGTHVGRICAGYLTGERTSIAWASVGVDMTAVPLATLTDGRAYTVDPLRPHTPAELAADWEHFLAEIRAPRE